MKEKNIFGDFVDIEEEPIEEDYQVEKQAIQVELTESIKEIPKEPCIEDGTCEHYELCSEHSLACVRFLHYCSNNKDGEKTYMSGKKRDMNTPTRAIYKGLFPNSGLDDSEVMIYGLQEEAQEEDY